MDCKICGARACDNSLDQLCVVCEDKYNSEAWTPTKPRKKKVKRMKGRDENGY